MRSRNCARIASALLSAHLLVALSGCSTSPPADAEWNLDRIDDTWGIEVPSSTKIRDYASSEVDFHGGRDDVFVLEIPSGDRIGAWDPAGYEHGIPHDGSPTVLEITDAAGAPIDEETADDLDCGEPTTSDQDYLLICFQEEDDSFSVFEQIF